MAVRLPAAVVQALDLKEGEEIELRAVGGRTFEVARKPDARELLARLREFRGRLPAQGEAVSVYVRNEVSSFCLCKLRMAWDAIEAVLAAIKKR